MTPVAAPVTPATSLTVIDSSSSRSARHRPWSRRPGVDSPRLELDRAIGDLDETDAARM
jgi:hypothetical protein